MRPIKFRGRDKRGNVFYGSYNQDMGVIDDWGYAACHAVNDKDVAQLVGYDKNGKEIYEGDTVLYANEEWTAELGGFVRNAKTLCHYNFKDVLLKKINFAT